MKKNETHISVTIETKEQLKTIAKKEDRTLRSVISRLVKDAYEAMKGM